MFNAKDPDVPTDLERQRIALFEKGQGSFVSSATLSYLKKQ